ncbi:MAG: dihydrolipoamide acetyltransferase family protein [Acidimicrobiales bacterium]
MAEVTMPQLGETVADGTVTRWFKDVGDAVTRGEPLFEVSTDKVDTEIPAPADGILTRILVDAGTTVDVGTVLAVIGDGEPALAVAVADEPTSAGAPAPSGDSPPPGRDRTLSPVVRRLLAQHHLNADAVTGTGPLGRVTREDVLTHVARAAAPSQATAPAGDSMVPFSRIRRLTAEHMVRSKSTSAHALMVREIDYEGVEASRRVHGTRFRRDEGFSLTYLPFNAVAALEALHDFPRLNASVGDDALIVHRDFNLSVAVDLDDDGLVAPVLRRADGYDLRGIARALHDLVERARSRQLGVDDLAAGTFTLSNPGPFGTLFTGAIINQPQVAILSTDAVTRRPTVVTDDEGGESIAIHSIGLVALTFDHRAIDGAYAARFLGRMSQIVTGRDWTSEL